MKNGQIQAEKAYSRVYIVGSQPSNRGSIPRSAIYGELSAS